MKRTKFTLTPNGRDRVTLADWAELALLLSGRSHLSAVDLRKALRSLDRSDESDVDISLGLLVNEVERRSELARQVYPFRFDNGGLSFDKTAERIAYVFLLLLSASPALREESRQAEVEALFDSVVLDALKSYLGPTSDGLRFGTPGDPERPTRFLDALRWLAGRMKLRLGPATRRPPKKNDGGADVVVWRGFRDGRTAFVTILAQCTVQFEWRGKAKDIVEDLWRGWIDFGKSPTTCLAVPFTVPPSYEKWDEVRRTVVILLDRLRIMELLEGVTLARRPQLEGWMRKELQMVSVAGIDV